jgi:hypothetical protein
VRILADPRRAAEVVDACFRETATIGLRHHETNRWILERREMVVELPEARVGVKLCRRPDGWTAKAESRDLTGFVGRDERQRIARLAEAAALQQNEADET